MESTGLARLIDSLVKIAHSRHRKQALRNIVLNPCGCTQRRIGIALQVALLDGLRIAYHFPAITRQVGAVNNKHAHGAAPRSFFILVSPSSVVRESLALEELRIVTRRPIDDDQCNFAFYIYA